MFYRVKLDVFEGPLDLLLHLVKKNEVELPDIPIAVITDQYLAYLDLLKQLDLDIAGEYLVMAATLLYLKSRLLLPVEATPTYVINGVVVKGTLNPQYFDAAIAYELDRAELESVD